MSNIIAGRAEEQEELLDMFHSKRAEFLILYGRRRIGKTFLIENFFGKKPCHFFHVTGVQHGRLAEQLNAFSESVGEAFYNGASIAPATTWLDAFKELSKAIENTPKDKQSVLFLDEFPWLCTKRSRLIQALDYYWNRFWKNDPRIKLVVCGSSASWIIRKIIHHKGGLHNRNTRTLLLRPFSLGETKLFFDTSGITLTHEQIVQIYMFCGGVPYYLNYIRKGKSAAQMIDRLCFQENGILYGEFDKLFDSLFDDAQVYKELIRIIAAQREGVSRAYIKSKNGFLAKGGTLTDRLKDLEDAAFIQSFTPLGHKRQGIYYRVVDEYCYFYLKWIEAAKKTLITREKNSRYWSSRTQSPAYYGWMGYVFEAICYKQIREVRQALDIGAGAVVGVWRYSPRPESDESGAQIDLIFDRDDGVTTLCEIKYTHKPFVIDKAYAAVLRRKIALYQAHTHNKKQLHLAFISANGVKRNKYYDELVHDVVTLDALFAGT